VGEQDNLQAIHKVYDAFGHGDVEGVISMHTFNIVKTGKVVDNDSVHTFRLADSKISAFEGYEDSAAVVTAFTAGSN
jgi:ketosteroid isomerase-like protein